MMSMASEAGSGLEAAFEDLPCMALIERDGWVVARNALARRMTGNTASAAPKVRLAEVLTGTAGNATSEERSRFDCMLVRRYGPPMAVNAVSHRGTFAGEECRLVMLMERGGQGPEGGSEGLQVEDLLDAIPEATVITHKAGIVHVNAEFTRLFGYTQAECVGQELAELVVPDGRHHERDLMLHTMRTAGRGEMETVRRTRNGEEVDVCVRLVRVRLGGPAFGTLVTYRDIRKQKQERARLNHSARHDALTGLPNRAQFLERVEMTLGRLRRRPDRKFAVIFVDLDGFKRVNDTMGHAAGDELLVQVADRLTRCLRPQDLVARFGGDEFALLVDESGGVHKVEAVATRLQLEIQRPVEMRAMGTAHVSASMGVTMAMPENMSAEEILSHADIAMYEAKAAGKARHVVFGGGGGRQC